MDSTMNDTVKINIKYTLKDIRDFSIVKTFSGVYRKILLIPAVLLLSLMIISVPVILFLSYWEPHILLVVLPIFIFALLFICAIVLLPMLVDYLVSRNSFIKSKALQGMNCLEFSRDKYRIYSAEGMSNLLWEEVYKIQELRKFFILYLSPFKMTIIPKRCFESQEQIVELKNILKDSLPKNKLRLKNYKFKKFSPDYGEVEFKNESSTMEESNKDNVDEDPEITLEFSLEKRDLLVTNFALVYTKPMGIIMTLVGLLFIISNVRSFKINSPSFFPMVIGIIFVFLMPILLIINSNRAYNNDPLIQKTIKYKIYKEYYLIDNPSGMSHIEFSKLVKIAETRPAILLYMTTQLFHMIPKRIFEGRQDDLLKLKEILSKYRKKRP